MRKIIFSYICFFCMGSAFANDIPLRPASCPDISLIKQTPFVIKLVNPQPSRFTVDVNYVGAQQIDFYNTQQVWAVDIYNDATTSLYWGASEEFISGFSADEVLKKSREILNSTSATQPYLNYFYKTNQWVCDYTVTTGNGSHVVAYTPIQVLDETLPA